MLMPTYQQLRLLLLLALTGLSPARGAAVVIDGSFSDWEQINPIYANPALPPGTTTGSPGVSFIKTYQADSYVYFCYAVLNPNGGSGFIAFDLDRNSNLRDNYTSMNAEAAWVLGSSEVAGNAVLLGDPTAARWTPDPANAGYQLFEWCFYRDEQLAVGGSLFPQAGEDVWFAVGTLGNSLASSRITTFTIDLSPVPEPGSCLLLGLALLTGFRRQRR